MKSTKEFAIGIKNANRGEVLKLISTEEDISRIEISKRMAVTKMTVSNIIGELIYEDIVEEKEVIQTNKVGRNPVIVDITDSVKKTIGISIDRDVCRIIITDLRMRVLEEVCLPLHAGNSHQLMDSMYAVLDEMTRRLPRMLAIGISAPGPLDARAGVIFNPPNFYGIENLKICDLLGRRYHLPVFLDNDNNCGALAEKLFGNGKQYHNFIYVGLSQGIGSGIVVDHSLYENDSVLQGELGHMGIDFQGAACSCGNRGCLENYASIPVILEKIYQKTGKTLTFAQACAMKNDGVIKEILDDMVEKLIYALVNYVNLFNPQAVLIGCEGYFLGDEAIAHIEEEVNRRKLFHGHGHIAFAKAKFENNSAVYGSVCCVLRRVFAGQMFL